MKSMSGFLAGLTIGIALVVLLLVIPTVHDIVSLRSQLFEEKRLLEQRYQQGMLFRQLREDWDLVQNDLPLLEEATLSLEKSVAFITRLETVTKEHGVQHQLTLPIETTKENAQEITVPFGLQWRGSWQGLLQALATVEGEPYPLPIRTLTIKTADSFSPVFSNRPFSRTALPEPSSRAPESFPLTMHLSGTTVWNKQ